LKEQQQQGAGSEGSWLVPPLNGVGPAANGKGPQGSRRQPLPPASHTQHPHAAAQPQSQGAGQQWGPSPQATRQHFAPPLPPPPQQQQQQWHQSQQLQQHHHWQQPSLQQQPQQQPHQVLQVWPSTLYPGGPNAAAALPGAMGLAYGGPGHGAGGGTPPRPGVLSGGDATWSALGMWGAASAAASAAGRRLDGSGGGGGGVSDLIPVNETADLGSRLAASHLLLQSFYESRDHTVQHRQANRAHARSMLLQRALGGGALSVAPFLAASASAAAAAAAWQPARAGASASALGDGRHSPRDSPHSPLARTAMY
jgi:hypothetical protein